MKVGLEAALVIAFGATALAQHARKPHAPYGGMQQRDIKAPANSRCPI